MAVLMHPLLHSFLDTRLHLSQVQSRQPAAFMYDWCLKPRRQWQGRKVVHVGVFRAVVLRAVAPPAVVAAAVMVVASTNTPGGVAPSQACRMAQQLGGTACKWHTTITGMSSGICVSSRCG